MATTNSKYDKLVEQAIDKPVICLYSTENYLLQTYAQKIVSKILSTEDAELTRIEGPTPSIEEAVAAAGTISFFGTKRVVELKNVEPSSVAQADIDALCDLINSLENACVIITCLFKEEKSKTTKKAKQIIDAASKIGASIELIKPSETELKNVAMEKAKELGASLSPQCAAALFERCKDDAYLIENEVAKLAAYSGYKEITLEMIQKLSTLNIEADVFDMVRFVAAKNKPKTFEKLLLLLQLQNEPIAITAALVSNFIDVYRVKCAVNSKRSISVLFKEYGYKGSDFRLKKAGETAAKYTKNQLKAILNILLQLDLSLKSSSIDKTLLLQTALAEIIETGMRK